MTYPDVFKDCLNKVSVEEIQNAIRSDGFFYMERAVTDSWIDRLLADVAEHPFSMNKNWITGVYAETQYYLTHMLACSRAFYQYCTHPKVFAICDRLLGDTYRLKAMRYYETYGRHHMQWHTDNKTDRGFAHIPGLIFIVYLADVNDGEFQYIRGSQNWSGDKAYSDYSDAFIEENYKQDVVSFKAPKGTLLIYDTYGIHRGKPVKQADFVRKSLFFQVDNKVDSAEPILLNPSFVDPKDVADRRITTYLGFGQSSEYAVYPDTSLKMLPLGRVGILPFVRWVGYRMIRGAYDIAPFSAKNIVRKMMGKPVR